jgi:hypothetical protein
VLFVEQVPGVSWSFAIRRGSVTPNLVEVFGALQAGDLVAKRGSEERAGMHVETRAAAGAEWVGEVTTRRESLDCCVYRHGSSVFVRSIGRDHVHASASQESAFYSQGAGARSRSPPERASDRSGRRTRR